MREDSREMPIGKITSLEDARARLLVRRGKVRTGR
jgi:hypothetical protein